MHARIDTCRLCGGSELDFLLSLGTQRFTGIFPKHPDDPVPAGPLELRKCQRCDLVQLAHSFDLSELYGQTYGYRSGLNRSMVAHLEHKVDGLVREYAPAPGDLIVDIGSNDGTLLHAYPKGRFTLVGLDPCGLKFKPYYDDAIQLIPDFFSPDVIRRYVGDRQAAIVTSIAMFYDLEDPLSFARAISSLLNDDGVWVAEQSYLHSMLHENAYDTICHEHLEYYGLKQIQWILERADLKLVDLEFNAVNGGSFAFTAAKNTSAYPECTALLQSTLREEEAGGLSTLAPFQTFATAIEHHRHELLQLIRRLRADGKTILGYGASTKGNVILQYLNLTSNELPFIAEVNEDKFGSYTPGTRIPIISETDARAMNPDYFLVLPWHFRSGIVRRETSFLENGGSLIFPLPRIAVVSTPDES